MTIYPDLSFYQFDKFESISSLIETIDNSKMKVEEYKQQIKMIICANPSTYIQEKRDLFSKSNAIGDNPLYWSIEKYISNKIDTIINDMSSELIAIVNMEYLLDEWTDDDYKKDLYNRMKGGEDVSEELEAIKHFEPVKDASFGYTINYKDDHRPSIYFRHKDYDTLYDIEEECEECQNFINKTVSEFKMWAMMDIPALAQAGMEAKDKTKYSDDKFDFTDVIRQLNITMDDELNFIEDEFKTLAKDNIIKLYYDTQEKDD